MRFCREFIEGVPVAVSFRIKAEFGPLTFRLPASVNRVYSVVQRSRPISPKFRTREQAHTGGVANHSTLARCPSEVSRCVPALRDLNRAQRNKTPLTQTRSFTFAIICTRKKRSSL